MLAAERQAVIYDLVRRGDAVKTSELKARLGASEMTIRRDLQELESRNLLRRVHGGAVPVGEIIDEHLFVVQSRVEVARKRPIAQLAAEIVCDGMSVAVDGSSTALEFARLLGNFKGITLVTNNLTVLWEFRGAAVNLISLGGSVAIDGNSLDGAFAVENARQLHVDAFFFSCAGFGAEGVTNASPVASEVRRTLLSNAKQNILLADSTKYGKKGFITLFDWSDVDILITDSGLTEDARDAVAQAAPQLDIRIAQLVNSGPAK